MSRRLQWPWKGGPTATVRDVSVDSGTQVQEEVHRTPGLQRELRSFQIFMIAISGIIGITIFTTMGEYLHTAGPAGLIVAICLVGLTAITVMESLGELVVQWPVQNAMVRYVEVFIDEDLATVVGLVYWYTYSSVVAVMLFTAAHLSQYWNLVSSAYIPVFYVVCPIVMIAINWFGIFTFGVIESIAGTLKLLYVLAGGFFLIVEGAIRYSGKNIDQGFHNDPDIAPNHTSAGIMIIPFLTYGFLGVEIVSVTAFEAKNPRTSLKNSARLIAYVVLALFILCGVGEAINMPWNATELPSLSVRDTSGQATNNTMTPHSLRDFSILVIATNRAGYPRLAGFFNAFQIFSVLSAGNTGLYVASRVLHGLAKENRLLPKWSVQWLVKLNTNNVPLWALLLSCLLFIWIPFLQLKKAYSVQSFLSVIITIGSVGTVLVWASQCLVYIYYYRWLRLHREDLKKLREEDRRRWEKYDRWMHRNPSRFSQGLSEMQPFTAGLGLLSSLLIVFVFSTATMWNHEVSAVKFFTAYGGPIFCGVTWAGLKLTRRLFGKQSTQILKMERNVTKLIQVIDEFERALFLRDPDIQLARRVATTTVLEEDDRNRSTPSTPHVPTHRAEPNRDDTMRQIGLNFPEDMGAEGHQSRLSLQDEDSPPRH